MLPTIKEIHTARAGTCWNILCCPLVSTIGNLWRSIQIYLLPCVGILWFRCINCLWGSFCCCFRWPYEDTAFIGATALGDHPKQSGREMEADTDWVRAKDLKGISGKRPQLFEGEIEPSDLCQGAVGDCWLVAAIACMAEFPDAIRRLFVTAEYNPRGLYKVRIFDPVKEKFVIVTVDDRIPCKKGTTTPRFMSPNGNELWAIILEKAYAKFCGSYAALDGGVSLNRNRIVFLGCDAIVGSSFVTHYPSCSLVGNLALSLACNNQRTRHSLSCGDGIPLQEIMSSK